MITYLRFYDAIVMDAIIRERYVSDRYSEGRLDTGELEKFVTTFASHAGMVLAFCDAMNYTDMAGALAAFEDRLNFGAKNEQVGSKWGASGRRCGWLCRGWLCRGWLWYYQ